MTNAEMYSLKNVTDVTSPHRISGTPQVAMSLLPPGVKLHLTPVTAISLIDINFTLSGHTQTAWLCPSQPELLQAESECTKSLPFPWASLLQAQTAKHWIPGMARPLVQCSHQHSLCNHGHVLMVIRVECLGDTHPPHPLWLPILTCLFF